MSPERNCSMHRDASPGVTLMLGVILLFLAATKPALIPKSLHVASLLRCLAKMYAAIRCFTNTIHRKEFPFSFLFSTKVRFNDSSFSDSSSLRLHNLDILSRLHHNWHWYMLQLDKSEIKGVHVEAEAQCQTHESSNLGPYQPCLCKPSWKFNQSQTSCCSSSQL
jgi:hypothetical protein